MHSVSQWPNLRRLLHVGRYAHIEGNKIKKNDKYEVKQILVMISCLLFSIAIAFPFMNWRHEPEGRLKPHHLENVSIMMLRHPPPPEGLWYTFDVTELMQQQGWSRKNSSLLHSGWKIYLVILIIRVHFLPRDAAVIFDPQIKT